MKKLFKGAVPTIALLLVAVMSLTSVTYAWFTAGDSATVETIDVNVKSVDGLLISSTGINGTWGSKISPDLTGTKALAEVSSSGQLESGKLVFYTLSDYTNNASGYNDSFDAITYAAKLSNTTENNQKTVGNYQNWIDFPLYIKNDKAETITVNLGGSTVNGTSFSEYAARVAIVQEATANATAMFQNGSYSYSSSPKLICIWEPNSEKHTADGTTWLANNNKDSSSYLGVYAATTETTVNQVFYNTATGDKYTIATLVDLSTPKTDGDKTYYATDNLPKDAEYYVYQPQITGTSPSFDADHFERLALEDFFTSISMRDIVGENGTLSDDYDPTNSTKTKVYSYDSSYGYVLVNKGAQLKSDASYYVKRTIGTAVSEIEDGKLVIFKAAKYEGFDLTDTDVIALTDADNNGFTIADLTLNGDKIKNIRYYGYDAENTCYKSLVLTAADFFTAETDVTSSNWDTEKANLYTLTDGKYVKVADDATFAAVTYYTYADLTLETIAKKNTNLFEALSDATALTNASGDVYKKATTAEGTTYTKVTNKAGETFAENTYYVIKDVDFYAENVCEILQEVSTKKSTTATASNGTENITFDIPGNTAVQLRVYIWIEGQDCDCTNSVAGVPFQVALKLNK